MEFRNSKQNFAMMASKFTMATWYTDLRVHVTDENSGPGV